MATTIMPTHPDSTSGAGKKNIHLALSGFSISRLIDGEEVRIELTAQELREAYTFQENRYRMEDILTKLDEMEYSEDLDGYTANEISSNDEMMAMIMFGYERNMDKNDMTWFDALYKAVHDAVSKATA